MRNRAIRGLLAAALFAALVTTARAATTDDDDDTPPPKQAAPSGPFAWWNNMFGDKPKPAEKVEKKKAERPVRPSGPTAAEREVLLQREKEANLRRLTVCDRLKAIALQQNDEAFLERIEALEKEIDELYAQRTAYLGQSPLVDEAQPRDKPKAAAPRASVRNRNTVEDDQ